METPEKLPEQFQEDFVSICKPKWDLIQKELKTPKPRDLNIRCNIQIVYSKENEPRTSYQIAGIEYNQKMSETLINETNYMSIVADISDQVQLKIKSDIEKLSENYSLKLSYKNITEQNVNLNRDLIKIKKTWWFKFFNYFRKEKF